MRLDLLWSDDLIWAVALALLGCLLWGVRYPHWRRPWRQIMAGALSAAATILLAFYVIIGLLDSVHWRMPVAEGVIETRSVLDMLMHPLDHQIEETYSAPFENTRKIAGYPWDIAKRSLFGLVAGVVIGGTLIVIFRKTGLKRRLQAQPAIAWRSIEITFLFLVLLVSVCAALAGHYHILGTDKIGRDVFYLTVKSIRTGLIIGAITTLFTLPFALFFGAIAGYFRGWVDDVVQYLYTTLNSIPAVLLIAASVLVLQVYINNHALDYPTLAQRADVRLLALCFILAVTGWADLCRFLRGETLKLRELEFVQAAKILGVSRMRIILRHIMPNFFHIVIITLVLNFSFLVLMESILSYIGVGVDPTTISWGNMINSSRLELAREPIVWWPLSAALIAMFGLVLAANIFADALRDAFDPYLQVRE
jgi:peptide/nickel transport system permease protein